MACETNTTSAGRAGQKAGITAGSSKSAFVAGVTSGVFSLPSRLKAKLRKRARGQKKKGAVSPAKKTKKVKEQKKNGDVSLVKKAEKTKEQKKKGAVSSTRKAEKTKGQKKKDAVSSTKKAEKVKKGAGAASPPQKTGGEGHSNGKATGSGVTPGQDSIFGGSAANTPLQPLSPGPVQVGQAKTEGKQGATAIHQQKPARPRPQIQVAGAFSGRELQNLSVQFRLDAAAARKQVQALKSGASRGIGHDDPRPADWARSDLKNYDFIVSQIGAESKRSLGRIDVSSLSDTNLVDLWDFSRHEADQAVRFIDHLQVDESHLKGATANYLTDKYKLKGRFCAHMAAQLEPMITPEMIADYERKS